MGVEREVVRTHEGKRKQRTCIYSRSAIWGSVLLRRTVMDKKKKDVEESYTILPIGGSMFSRQRQSRFSSRDSRLAIGGFEFRTDFRTDGRRKAMDKQRVMPGDKY
jgi:hypothetical protein